MYLIRNYENTFKTGKRNKRKNEKMPGWSPGCARADGRKVAEQQAERQKFIVQMAEQEKLAQIKKAEGQE